MPAPKVVKYRGHRYVRAFRITPPAKPANPNLLKVTGSLEFATATKLEKGGEYGLSGVALHLDPATKLTDVQQDAWHALLRGQVVDAKAWGEGAHLVLLIKRK